MCTLKLSLVDVCSLEKGNFLTSMKNKMTNLSKVLKNHMVRHRNK